MLNVRTYPLGYIQTNCYVVSNTDKQCLIVDPGGDGDKLIRELHETEYEATSNPFDTCAFRSYWCG